MADGDIGPKIVLEGEKEYKRAISDVNKDMRVLASEMKAVTAEFDGNANSIEALRKKNGILNNEYDEQIKKVKTLQGALENSEKIYGANSNQVKDWQIKLNNAEAELSKLDKELKTNDKYMGEAESSTNGTAKSIDEFGKEIKVAGDNTLKTGDIIKANLTSTAIIGGVKALGSAMATVAKTTVDLVKDTAAYADDMLTLSTQTGVSTDKLQAYNYMAELTDVSLDDMTKTMARNIKGMDGAQKGTKDYVEAYQKLGVEIKDSNGNLRDSEEVYWDVIDSLGKMENQTEADALAMRLFGKSAQDLNPLIAIGSKGVAGFTKEAKEMGAVLDKDALSSLGETDDALQRMNQSVDIAKRKFGAEMAPAITDATTKITDKITAMDGELADMAGGALSMVTDGLVWVIDNSDLVASGLAGIGAAMITQGAVTTITSAVGAYQKFKLATEGATVAQWALNAAQSANPIGLVAVAVVGLSAALVVYGQTQDESTEKFKEFEEQISSVITESDRLVDSVKSSKDALANNTGEIVNNFKAVQTLSDKLFDLAGKENKSNTEKAQMQAMVNQLNKTIPDLNLVMDEQTGILNLQKTQVDELTESFKQKALSQAYEERYLELTKEQIELQENLKTSTEAVTEAEKALSEAKAEANDISSFNREGQQRANKLVRDYEEQLNSAKENVKGLSSELGNNTESLKDTETHLGTTASATENYASVTSDANDKINGSLAETEEAYKKAKEAAIDSIQSQIDIFGKFSESSEVTKEELFENLKSQVEGITEWADNVESLSNRGINEGLLADLKEMGPSAAGEIAALNKMSDKELKEYSKTWEKLGKATVKGAEKTTADSKAAYDKAYKEEQKAAATAGKESIDAHNKGAKSKQADAQKVMTSVVKNTIAYADTNSSSEAKGLGESVADGIKKGVNNKKSTLGTTMASLAESMLTSFKKKLKINSPSKVFEEQAEWIPEGAAIGIRNKTGVAVGAMESLSKSLTLGDVSTDYEIGTSSRIANMNSSSSTNESNELGSLISAIGNLASRPLVLSINGREFALATAQDMSIELQSLNRMGSRRIGVV